MARTLFVHIGIHKTGTSAIQNVCRANHDELLRAGILFPLAGFTKKPQYGETATSGHRGLLDFFKEPGKKSASQPGRALLHEIEASLCSRIVISSEVFSAPHNRGAVEGVSWFRQQGFDVRIVVYLRRQDFWLDSFYRERLKWGGKAYCETRSIDEFWRAEGERWLNYRDRLGIWVDAAGLENAVIRSYEDTQEAGGVVADFLKVIGAEERLLDLRQSGDSHNPSLPSSAADLLRAFNEFPDSEPSCRRQLVLAVSQMKLFTHSTGSLISAGLWRELESAYGEQNEELRRSWVSGSSEKLSFYMNIRQSPFAAQAISYADSVLLIRLLKRAVERRFGDNLPESSGREPYVV